MKHILSPIVAVLAILAVPLVFIATGCNSDGTLTTKTQNVIASMITIACTVDTVLQPLATVVGPDIAEANVAAALAHLAAKV